MRWSVVMRDTSSTKGRSGKGGGGGGGGGGVIGVAVGIYVEVKWGSLRGH